MAHATAFCPFCDDEHISMSSSVLARKRRLSHIKRKHPDEDFEDTFLKMKGEDYKA